MTLEQTMIIGALTALHRVSYMLVFFAGVVVGFAGVILLGHITSWIESRKRDKYKEIKMGDDLFDVEIPDFMPHDEDN